MRTAIEHTGHYRLHHTPTILTALWPEENPLPKRRAKKHYSEFPSNNHAKVCPCCGRDFKAQKKQVCCSRICARRWSAGKEKA